MKTRTVVVLAVAGAIVFFVLIGGGIAAFVYFAGRGFDHRAPNAEERKLILTAQQFSAFADIDPKCEQLVSRRGIDGTREIESEYQCSDESLPAITSTAEISKTLRDARETYRIGIGAFKLGTRIGGATLRETNALRIGGDEQYAAELRTDDGARIGHFLVIRQGRIVLSLLVVGFHFEDANDLKALMQPLLEEAAKR